MIAFLLLASQAATPASQAPSPPSNVAATPPADWTAMPLLPLPMRTASDAADPAAFVRREVEAGRCKALGTPGRFEVTVRLAILVQPAGVRQIVPEAIGCAAVEQYTVGYVSTTIRNHPPEQISVGWYRLPVTYRW